MSTAKLKKACRLLMHGVYGDGYLTNCGAVRTEQAVALMREAGLADPRKNKTPGARRHEQ